MLTVWYNATVAVVWSSILYDGQLWLLALQSNQAVVSLCPSIWDTKYSTMYWSNEDTWEGKIFHLSRGDDLIC